MCIYISEGFHAHGWRFRVSSTAAKTETCHLRLGSACVDGLDDTVALGIPFAPPRKYGVVSSGSTTPHNIFGAQHEWRNFCASSVRVYSAVAGVRKGRIYVAGPDAAVSIVCRPGGGNEAKRWEAHLRILQRRQHPSLENDLPAMKEKIGLLLSLCRVFALF